MERPCSPKPPYTVLNMARINYGHIEALNTARLMSSLRIRINSSARTTARVRASVTSGALRLVGYNRGSQASARVGRDRVHA